MVELDWVSDVQTLFIAGDPPQVGSEGGRKAQLMRSWSQSSPPPCFCCVFWGTACDAFWKKGSDRFGRLPIRGTLGSNLLELPVWGKVPVKALPQSGPQGK